MQGDILVSASFDHTIRVWNWQKRTCERVLSGHTDSVQWLEFYGQDGLLSASNDSFINAWNLVCTLDIDDM